jgi:hypothetical protein
MAAMALGSYSLLYGCQGPCSPDVDDACAITCIEFLGQGRPYVLHLPGSRGLGQLWNMLRLHLGDIGTS